MDVVKLVTLSVVVEILVEPKSVRKALLLVIQVAFSVAAEILVKAAFGVVKLFTLSVLVEILVEFKYIQCRFN